jgi:hypothetical protein
VYRIKPTRHTVPSTPFTPPSTLMLATVTDLRRSAHGWRGHWANLLNIRPNKMSSAAFAKIRLRTNATVAGGSGAAIRSCVSIATRTSGHETSATMATRITLAHACCGNRREQCLSNNGSLRLVDSMASAEHRTARQSSSASASRERGGARRSGPWRCKWTRGAVLPGVARRCKARVQNICKGQE